MITKTSLSQIFSQEQLNNLSLKQFEDILLFYNDKFTQSSSLDISIPKEFISNEDLNKFTNRLYYSKSNNDLESLNKSLSQPIWDLLDRGGKRIRPVLCFIISEMYGKPWDYVLPIASCCESIHNASLLVDDVEDDSQVRRSKPCVHKTFGTDIALNAGNFLYFSSFYRVLTNQSITQDIKSQLTMIYMEEMVNLHLGQAWDILWHNQNKLGNKIPTVDQYLQMVSYKTGVLLRVSARMTGVFLQLSTEIQNKLAVFAERIGIGFQIQDDILNLEGEEFAKSKGLRGEDIHEGKMSIMVIHALNTLKSEDASRLKEILVSKPIDQNIIDEAIQLIKKTNSIEYSRNIANQIIQQAWEELEPFLPNNEYKNVLKLFSQFCSQRKI